MRIAHLILASLLAMALGAGGEDHNTPNTHGGAGGPGGDGGTGGTGGEQPDPITCGGVRVIEMQSATSATLNDHTDTVDNWDGSCSPLEDPELTGGPRKPGNDVIVRFVVPETGTYRFTTAGSDFDTLLYVLEDCMDGFTELKCNDDFESKQSGVTVVDRTAGEDIFVVVDSVGIRQSRPFTLTAEKIEATAPVIDEMTAYFNGAVRSAGLRVSGQNPGRPLVAFSLKLYGAGGAELFPTPFVFRFDEINILEVTQENGEFLVEGSFSYGDPPQTITAIEIGLIDDYDLASAVVKENVIAPPTVGRGEPCDPAQALNVCEGTDVCPTPTSSTDVPVCTAAP